MAASSPPVWIEPVARAKNVLLIVVDQSLADHIARLASRICTRPPPRDA